MIAFNEIDRVGALDSVAKRTIGRIPIRNIWLLLLYASDIYRELPQARRVNLEDAPDDIPNLVAELLTHAVERRMRRNLSFGYQHRHADLNRVCGRIDLLRTERHQLLQQGKIACSFEELTIDTPRNRFVRAALLKLAKVVQTPALTRRCRSVAASMEHAGVTGSVRYRGRRVMPFDRLGRLDADDRQMLAAARLAFDLALPSEDIGVSQFSIPDRDEHWARRLFERAVGGFYAVVLSKQDWQVRRGNRINWTVKPHTPGLREILPSMQTDIVLEHRKSGRRIVIDTKFTSVIERGWHRDKSLKTEHIYQLYAYLRSQERTADPLSLNATGILLYPSVDGGVNEAGVIQGHEIRFVTVNLAANSRSIRDRLLEIANDSPLDNNS